MCRWGARRLSEERLSGVDRGEAHLGAGGASSCPIVPVTVTGPVKVPPSGGLRPTLTGPPLCQATVGYASRAVVTSVLRHPYIPA